MTVRQRVLNARLIEKVQKNPELAKALYIKVIDLSKEQKPQ